METSKFANFFNPNNLLQPVIITDAIKLYFHWLDQNKRKYTISNSAQMADLYAGICMYVKQRCYKRFPTLQEAKNAIGKYLHIYGPSDLAEVLAGNDTQLKKAGYSTDIFVGCKGKRGRGKKAGKTKMKGYTSARCCKDASRSIAIRGRYGNYPVMFFEITGRMDGCSKEIIDAKMEYHFQTGCPYFQASPVLLSTWLTFPKWRQDGTITVEKVGDKWD